MATIYHSVFATEAAPLDLLSKLNVLLDIPPENHLSATSTSVRTDAITAHVLHATLSGGEAIECQIAFTAESAHSVSIQICRSSEHTLIAITEDIKGAAARGGRLPAPAPFCISLATFALSRALGGASSDLRVFVLSDSISRPPIEYELRRRLQGMVSDIRITDVTDLDLGTIGLEDPRPGSVHLVLPKHTRPISFPSVLVRMQPESVACRIHSEVVEALSVVSLPPQLAEAIYTLRASRRDDQESLDLAESYAREADTARDEYRSLFDELEGIRTDHDDTLRELDLAQRRIQYLESALREQGQFVLGQEEPPDAPVIEWTTEALEYARETLSNVHISEECEVAAAELDEHRSASIFAQRAWAALVALNDYARSKSNGHFKGDFKRYCQEQPQGYRIFPENRVALTESETTETNQELRRARTFRVPTSVDKSGRAYMGAHLKVANASRHAPRLHFLDDTSGSTGQIIVGYLGPHLPLFDD